MTLNKTWLLTRRRVEPHHRSDALNHGQGERWSVAASDTEAKRLRARDIVATKRLLAALRREHGGCDLGTSVEPSHFNAHLSNIGLGDYFSHLRQGALQ